ncbi:hypothetical protein GE09DRAFT_764214 [Coniochaeta sp. 2T2.1]|nr:hypothetical protein GE09DRAFT_764214 [Coniochaeta sp. 2T2.1]
MLRHRQSLKSKPTLSHRKSTSSARSVILEHLDPIVAQRDAQVAAHQAFTRAQDRSSVEMPLFPPPPSPSRLREAYSQDDSTHNDNGDAHATETGQPSIPRRQSVRFVGPCTVNNRGSASKLRPQTPASDLRGALDPATVVDTPSGQNLAVPTLYHPQARPGTSASTHSTKTLSNYLHSLAAADDVYTKDDDIASLPSSYHHLRRPSSLHPSLKACHNRDSGDSFLLPPAGLTRDVRTSMSMRTLDPNSAKENFKPQKIPTLKAPKSMSFLKGRRSRVSSITSHDNSTNIQGNPNPDHKPLRAKTSSFFGSKAKREESGLRESGLRKTLRSSSSNAELLPTAATSASGDAYGDTGLPLPKHEKGSLRVKARKASKTLRSKFLNLFSSAKGDAEIEFPDQHVKSQKQHADGFVSYITGPDDDIHQDGSNKTPLHHNHGNRSQDFPTTQGSRACSRKVSLPAFKNKLWGQGSNEEKALDDKSRVTSWTNSGPSTLTSEQQLAWTEWEKQRLSIIKENGAHCPSPSLRRQALGTHVLQSQESLIGQPLPPGPTVDSQRVYAALMERLAQTTRFAQVEQQRKSIEEARPVATLHNSAFDDYEDNGAKPAPLIVRRSTSSAARDGDLATHSNPTSDHGKALQPPVALTPWSGNHSATDGHGITSAERTNAFFGSPEAHLFRTISPYRRALRKSMEEAEDDMHGRNSGDRIISDCGTEIRRPERASFDDTYSESVYSTDDPAPGAINRMQSLAEVVERAPSSVGNMSMSVDPPVTYRPTGHRQASSVSSIDWKTWLSANVARLEPSPSPPRHSEVESTPTAKPNSYGYGHVRERAQIEDDGEFRDLRQDVLAAYNSAHPSSAARALESDPPKISPLKISTLRATPSSINVLVDADNRTTSSGLQDPFDRPLPSPELPPAIPPRSLMRKTPYALQANAKPSKDTHDEATPSSQSRDESHTPKHALSTTYLRERDTNTDLPCTPTPKPTRLNKKRSGFLYTPSVAVSNAASSPGLTAAVEKQFGPANKLPPTNDENKENEVSRDSHGMRKSGFLSSVGSSSEEKSAKGKRMVDVFLSSRRKRMASNDTDSPAFL